VILCTATTKTLLRKNLELLVDTLLLVATVRAQVTLSLFTDFENFTKFNPASFQEKAVNTMLDEVVAWGGALRTLRTKEGLSMTIKE
jgi:hypothetical protein